MTVNRPDVRRLIAWIHPAELQAWYEWLYRTGDMIIMMV